MLFFVLPQMSGAPRNRKRKPAFTWGSRLTTEVSLASPLKASTPVMFMERNPGQGAPFACTSAEGSRASLLQGAPSMRACGHLPSRFQ